MRCIISFLWYEVFCVYYLVNPHTLQVEINRDKVFCKSCQQCHASSFNILFESNRLYEWYCLPHRVNHEASLKMKYSRTSHGTFRSTRLWHGCHWVICSLQSCSFYSPGHLRGRVLSLFALLFSNRNPLRRILRTHKTQLGLDRRPIYTTQTSIGRTNSKWRLSYKQRYRDATFRDPNHW